MEKNLRLGNYSHYRRGLPIELNQQPTSMIFMQYHISFYPAYEQPREQYSDRSELSLPDLRDHLPVQRS